MSCVLTGHNSELPVDGVGTRPSVPRCLDDEAPQYLGQSEECGEDPDEGDDDTAPPLRHLLSVVHRVRHRPVSEEKTNVSAFFKIDETRLSSKPKTQKRGLEKGRKLLWVPKMF